MHNSFWALRRLELIILGTRVCVLGAVKSLLLMAGGREGATNIGCSSSFGTNSSSRSLRTSGGISWLQIV